MEDSGSIYIYIVFSDTPCKIGGFIRAVTHGIYNHVSVALDRDLSEMYSFARLKRDTPFCGGFVIEGAERYRLGSRTAKISVCRIKVGTEGSAKVRSRIRDMKEHPDIYVYNMISAMLAPWRKHVYVRDSFTCVEFAVEMLNLAGIKLSSSCYSAMELYTQLSGYEVYTGEYPETASVADDSFCDHISIPGRTINSVKQLGRLMQRLILR